MNIREVFEDLTKDRNLVARRSCWWPDVYIYHGPPQGMMDYQPIELLDLRSDKRISFEGKCTSNINYHDIMADDWQAVQRPKMKEDEGT